MEYPCKEGVAHTGFSVVLQRKVKQAGLVVVAIPAVVRLVSMVLSLDYTERLQNQNRWKALLRHTWDRMLLLLEARFHTNDTA